MNKMSSQNVEPAELCFIAIVYAMPSLCYQEFVYDLLHTELFMSNRKRLFDVWHEHDIARDDVIHI